MVRVLKNSGSEPIIGRVKAGHHGIRVGEKIAQLVTSQAEHSMGHAGGRLCDLVNKLV